MLVFGVRGVCNSSRGPHVSTYSRYLSYMYSYNKIWLTDTHRHEHTEGWVVSMTLTTDAVGNKTIDSSFNMLLSY